MLPTKLGPAVVITLVARLRGFVQGCKWCMYNKGFCARLQMVMYNKGLCVRTAYSTYGHVGMGI